MWKHPPFKPVIEGDWMYGRGAGGMKAGTVAALFFALDAIKNAGFEPAANLHFQSVIEKKAQVWEHYPLYSVDTVPIWH